MGLFASHSIVFAQVIIDGRKFGTLPFLVQLRDIKTWKLLPGIKAGDMGSKMGFNGTSNGWAIFDNVRIPRD